MILYLNKPIQLVILLHAVFLPLGGAAYSDEIQQKECIADSAFIQKKERDFSCLKTIDSILLPSDRHELIDIGKYKSEESPLLKQAVVMPLSELLLKNYLKETYLLLVNRAASMDDLAAICYRMRREGFIKVDIIKEGYIGLYNQHPELFNLSINIDKTVYIPPIRAYQLALKNYAILHERNKYEANQGKELSQVDVNNRWFKALSELLVKEDKVVILLADKYDYQYYLTQFYPPLNRVYLVEGGVKAYKRYKANLSVMEKSKTYLEPAVCKK